MLFCLLEHGISKIVEDDEKLTSIDTLKLTMIMKRAWIQLGNLLQLIYQLYMPIS